MKTFCIFLVLLAPAFAQQTNSNIVPASPGLNIGTPTQRWNGNFDTINANKVSINGGPTVGAGFGLNFAGLDSANVYSGTNIFNGAVTFGALTSPFGFQGAGQSTLSLGDNTSVTVLPAAEMTFGSLNGVPHIWFGSTDLGHVETSNLEGAVGGLATLNNSGVVPVAQLATNPGSCNGSTFLAGNNTCATPGGGGGGTSWPLEFSSGANVSTSATNTFGVGELGSGLTNTQWPVPRAGTVGPGFYCRSSQALTSTMQYVLTMRKGLAASGAITSSTQAITCTISGGGTTASCNDTTHTFTVAVGDVIDVQVVPSNTPTAATLNCGVVFQ